MPQYTLPEPWQGNILTRADVPFEMRRYKLSFATAISAHGGFGSYLWQDYLGSDFMLKMLHFSMHETMEINFATEEPLFMLIFLLEGSAAINLNNQPKAVLLKKNSYLFFYLPAAQKKAMGLGKGRSAILNIAFTVVQLKNIIKAYGLRELEQYHDRPTAAPIQYPPMKISRRMRQHIQEMLSCKAVTNKIDLFLKVRLLDILFDLLDDIDVSVQPRFMSSTSTKHIDDVGKFILDNLDRPLTNNILAKKYGKGITAFKIDFTSYHKIPPHAFVKRERLLRAKSLILQTEEQIGTIAVMVGYTEITGFNRSFKEMFGNTPIWFRKNKPPHT